MRRPNNDPIMSWTLYDILPLEHIPDIGPDARNRILWAMLLDYSAAEAESGEQDSRMWLGTDGTYALRFIEVMTF